MRDLAGINGNFTEQGPEQVLQARVCHRARSVCIMICVGRSRRGMLENAGGWLGRAGACLRVCECGAGGTRALFRGIRFVTIRLAKSVRPTAVSVEHVHHNLTLEYDSAPKDISVWVRRTCAPCWNRISCWTRRGSKRW